MSSLVRHTVYNAAGLVAPIVSAIVAIPILIHMLGADRFGILTLVWAIVNYFGIFDLGLGRALTLQLAILFSKGRDHEVNELVCTTLVALLALGLLAGGILLASTPLILVQVSGKVDQGEIVGTVAAMACALPFIVVTTGVRGALEAKSAFGILNAIRIPMGIVNFALPVAIAVLGAGRLDDISWSLAAARVFGLVLHAYFLVRLFPLLLTAGKVRWGWLKTLLANGGWMTVSNIAGPLMGYLDRFIVGFLISAASVAYYATPQELILKVYVIPGALTAVLFPAFASNQSGSRSLYQKSLWSMGAILAPGCAVGFFGAHQILSLWVSVSFADQSYRTMQILMLGVACGAMSAIPYTYLQAIGRSNLTAISHVIQLPAFLVGSYLLTSKWGIEGAATAWSARLAIDAIVLFVAAHLLPPRIARISNAATTLEAPLADF